MNSAFVSAPEEDIVVSARVRLARNYEDIPFSTKMTSADAQETVRRAATQIASSSQASAFRLVYVSSLSDAERKRLVERRLISYDLLKYADRAAALISSGETISIMINEDDHLRIQGILPGQQLEKAASLAFGADDLLCRNQPIAFDAKWGYLTACPTNAGTGMRASVTMHLPALTNARKMGPTVQAVGKLGFTLRGVYGEDVEADGNLYQLSNHVTMGRSEEDVLKSLAAVAAQVAEQEREERKAFVEQDADAFADKMMRSVGILLNARLLDEKEFMRLYSDIRYASGVGLLDAPIAGIDALMQDAQPASLNVLAGETLSDRDRQLLRASEVRSKLSQLIDENENNPMNG